MWMCHSRTNNRKINRLHEGCLRILYNNKLLALIELLTKDDSFFFRERFCKIQVTEMYRIRNHLALPIVKDLFVKNRNHSNFRQDSVNIGK